jgi:hypothetical protein
MYVVSGHERGHFGTQAGHVTRLIAGRPGRKSTKSTKEYEGSI